jgi:acetyl-CoA C-acetyltransferase
MLVGQGPRRVAIVGGIRIPFARANGAYKDMSNQDLLTATLRALVAHYGLGGQRVGEVAAGAVMKHPAQWNLTRESVLASGLAADTPGLDVQRASGTSLEAAILLANKIALGQIDSGVAAGVDTVSDPPVVFPKSFQQRLLRSYRGASAAARWSSWLGLRPRDLRPVLPGLTEPRTGLSMAGSAELLVKRWGVKRADQDQYAFESHTKAAAAYESGFYRRLVFGSPGIAEDDQIRRDISLDKLASLPTLFDAATGTLTAGNAAPSTDGAAAVLLATEQWARERDLPVLAYLRHGKVAAVDFVHERENLLMAPAFAVAQMLADARLSLQDFDYYEFHEAFAAQVLCTLAAWNDAAFCRERLKVRGALGTLNRQRLNVKGGSLALGDPCAATGARLLATLAQLLDETKAKRGLISICTAGGMGVAAILER